MGYGRFPKVAEMESFGLLFGRLIREKRGIEGLSQDALALKSGLTKARISEIETAKISNPQAKTVDALCVALNISREERESCRTKTGPRLPPRLLENLALRFGLDNPDASENELEAFLKEKAIEFREFQERLAQIDAAEGKIADLLAAATIALEQGDFQLADKQLAEAENVHLTSATLPSLERQYKLTFERGNASLLVGEIKTAASHWERATNYFHYIDENVESEKRYGHCTWMRQYAYRYRSVEALLIAERWLEANLCVWTKERSMENWCKAMNALAVTKIRLYQFDTPENFTVHINAAKCALETIRANCSKSMLPNHYRASLVNLGAIYATRRLSQSDEEYRRNMVKCLEFENEALSLVSKENNPEQWGIIQHNLGHDYVLYSRLLDDKSESMPVLDKAVCHAERSFDVRRNDIEDELQYGVASCRTLGEALLERSRHKAHVEAQYDLNRAFEVLSGAVSKISKEGHPNQWDEIQQQLEVYSEQREAVEK